jgi:hypothetical protein
MKKVQHLSNIIIKSLNQNKMEEEKAPEIINKIVEFFNFWSNPDDEKGEYKSIKEFQLRIYDVSCEFVFKWYITEKELQEVSDFIGNPIENNMLSLGISEYFLELAVKPK